jgi:prepilin-type N-terminal cleavage/methylation domain-containing protein
MVTASCRVARRRRVHEHGFTLIELLVSIAILAVIGSVIATVFSVGLRVMHAGGPQDRLFGANDLSALEQALGQDGARAACVQVPGGTKYGSCTSGGFGKAACPSSDLCLGWPQISDSTCHVADYSTGASTNATRIEWVVSGVVRQPSTGTSTYARAVPVSLSVTSVATGTPTGETYAWVRSLTVQITAIGVSSGPTASLVLHPVATDPAGASANITQSGTNPC